MTRIDSDVIVGEGAAAAVLCSYELPCCIGYTQRSGHGRYSHIFKNEPLHCPTWRYVISRACIIFHNDSTGRNISDNIVLCFVIEILINNSIYQLALRWLSALLYWPKRHCILLWNITLVLRICNSYDKWLGI